MDDDSNTQDIQLLNILINSKKELREFLSGNGEDTFLPNYRRFAKRLFGYFKIYNSCPSLTTLIEHATSNTNSNLEEYLIDTWKEIEEQYTDPREFTFILQKLNNRKNYDLLFTLKGLIDDKLDSDDPYGIAELNKAVKRVTGEINSIGETKSYKCVSLRDIEPYVERFTAKQKNPALSQGIMTGFSVMDYFTNGLRPAELGVIAGSTGGGKSVFLVNLGVNIWMGDNKLPTTIKELNQIIKNNSWLPGNDVLFITLEMPEEEVEDRIISCMCGIDSLDLMKGKLAEGEPEKLNLALKFRKHYPGNFRIADVPRGCSMSQIQSIFDEVCLEFRPKIVIIDYLGLMIDNDKDSDADWEKLKDISEEMHEFGRTNDVSVFTALQIKTAKPGVIGVGLHAIGRSSMILHNVNLALQIEDRENEDMRPDSVIHCIKFRRGPKFIMNNLRKEFQYTRFADSGLANSVPEKEVGKFGEDLSSLMDAMLYGNMEEDNTLPQD